MTQPSPNEAKRRDLVIAGYGGLGKEVAFLVEALAEAGHSWNLLGYVGADRASVGREIGRYKVVGDDQWLTTVDRELHVALAVGNLALLRALHYRLRSNRLLRFPNLIHPSVTGDWARIRVGEGNIVLNGAAFTTDIALGSFNVINPGCTVSHDCVVGSYNLLGPGVHLAGAVKIGDRVLLGVGAKVLPGASICNEAVIGGGAVVTKNLTEPAIFAGVPARRIRRNEAQDPPIPNQ